MDDRDQLPEFVRDTELATEFRNDRAITVHFRHLDRKKREFWHRQQPPIGHGGYGLVWLERQIDHHGTLSDSKLRAVKQIRLSSTRTALEDYVRELEAIAKFSQDKYADYFVKSTGWFMDPDSLFIAMEYCPCGDLKRYLEAKGAVGEENAKIIVSQILKGLAHMHREKFAHRDLKPANVLLVKMPPDEWLVKLSDFGLTKRAVGLESTTVKGTYAYLPPELMEDNARRSDHFAGDIWCVGETAFELITGATAFGGNVISRFKYTQDAKAFPTTELEKANASPQAFGFIMSTMAASPPDRPTSSQALDDPWILEDDAGDSPQLPSIQGAWPDSSSLGPPLEGTNVWSTGLAPEGTAFTLPTSEAYPVASPVPDSVKDNADMDGGLREAQKKASESDQGRLVKHEVDPRTSPRHAAIGSISAEAVTKRIRLSNEHAVDDQFASENRTVVGHRGTRSDPAPKGSQVSPSATSLKVSSQPSDQHCDDRGGELRSTQAQHAFKTPGFEYVMRTKQRGQESSQPVLPRLTIKADRTKDRVIAYRSNPNNSSFAFEKSDTLQPDYPYLRTAEGTLVGVTSPHVLPTLLRLYAPRLYAPDAPARPRVQQWNTMLDHAEAQWPIYGSGAAFPSAKQLLAKLTGKAGPHSPSVFIFLYMMDEETFGFLRLGDQGGDTDLRLFLLRCLHEREEEAKTSGSAIDVLQQKTYTVNPSLSTGRCYHSGCRQSDFIIYGCQSCGDDFCVVHRHKSEHACKQKGQSSRPLIDMGSLIEGVKQKAEEATVTMPEKPAGYSSASSIDGTPKRAGQATRMIILYNWDDHSVSRKRPDIGHVIRQVRTTDGKLFLGRAQPGSFDYFVVGFKSKVVSRDHAVIRFQGEQCTIQDLGSASGTFLKGKRLSAADSRSEPHVLRNGDMVRLGTDYSEHTEDSTYGAVQFIVELERLTNSPEPPLKARTTLKDKSGEASKASKNTESQEQDKQPNTSRGFRQLGKMLFK